MNKVVKLCLNVLTLSIIALSTFSFTAAFYAYKDLSKTQEVVVYEPATNAKIRWDEEKQVYEAINFKSVVNESIVPEANCFTYFCRQFEGGWRFQTNEDNPNQGIVEFYGRKQLDGDKYDYKIKVLDQTENFDKGLKPVVKTYTGKDVLSLDEMGKATKNGHLTRVINQNFLFVGQEKYYPFVFSAIAFSAMFLSFAYYIPYQGSKLKRLSLLIITITLVNAILILSGGPYSVANNLANEQVPVIKIILMINGVFIPAYLRAGLKKLK